MGKRKGDGCSYLGCALIILQAAGEGIKPLIEKQNPFCWRENEGRWGKIGNRGKFGDVLMVLRRLKAVFSPSTAESIWLPCRTKRCLDFQSVFLGTGSCWVCSALKKKQQVVMSERPSQKIFKYRSWRRVVRERVSNHREKPAREVVSSVSCCL